MLWGGSVAVEELYRQGGQRLDCLTADDFAAFSGKSLLNGRCFPLKKESLSLAERLRKDYVISREPTPPDQQRARCVLRRTDEC